MQRFQDKVILVTGAGRGIGFSIAEQFALEGGTVILTDLDSEKVEKAAEKLQQRSLKAISLPLNVADAGAWVKAMEEIETRFHRLDVVVNNAGINSISAFEEMSIDQWRAMQTVNIEGVILGMQNGIELMKRNSSGGTIVNIASVTAKEPVESMVGYGASKAAVSELTRSAAVECARKGYGIRINAIHPGFVDTPMIDSVLEAVGEKGSTFAKNIYRRIPMKRLAKSSEIAGPVLFLASDAASYITGTDLVVDGGYISG